MDSSKEALEDMQRIVESHAGSMERQVQQIRDRASQQPPETPQQAAEGYLAKLTRWDDMLNLGQPGKRALRKEIRAEMATIRRALLMGRVMSETEAQR